MVLTDYDAKITDIEGKILDVSNLATKTALTTVENKIPDVSNLVKKTDYDIKVTEIESKLNNNHDTSEFNKLTADVFNARLAQVNLITKTDFDAKLLSLNKKITSLSPLIDYVGNKIGVKFTGSCLKQSNKLIYTHGKVVNIYIVYELGASSSHVNDPTLKNCLFGAVTLTKNADIDKYGYSGYGIGFDRRGSFSFPGGGFAQNVIILGVDMSFSAHIDNKKKDILVFGIGPTQ